LVVSFDTRVILHSELGTDRSRLRRAVFQIGEGKGTRLYDAIDLVATSCFDAVPDPKAIVPFTDGVDTQSRLATAASTEVLAGESQVSIHAIEYDTRRKDEKLNPPAPGFKPKVLPEGALDNTPLYMRADRYLESITDASGGRLYRARTLLNVNDAFAEIARDIRQQYTLCYYPMNQAADGTARSLRVKVNRPGVRVRTRAGYRAATGAPSR
jgi:VWFA-related protein